ncbi:HD domain-containing protein [Ruminococcaceae bacterium KH2T8]|nr:HD domain-containing protein [Ruminococcaceae bacterium KH2T8]
MEDAYTLTPEQIEADKIRIIELLKGTGRPGIERLVEWMETKSDFFTAPASTKYHLHCKGGLARHSLNVYERLKAKVDSGLLELKDDTVVITTLLHDVCKANFYAVQKRNRKIDGQWQEVEEWGIDEKLPIGHGEKSCYIVQSFMRLSPEEFAMIRFHMGRESESFNDYFSKAAAVFPGVAAIHTADLESAFIVESRM